MKAYDHDVFISHASEDKDAFVTPLAEELRRRGLVVWFDKFEIGIGDSLREVIERGLAKSRYGIVVYSPWFFKKRWPKKELDGLFAREVAGKKRILPVLHNLSIEELRKRYPIQASKYTPSSNMPLDQLCEAFIREIRPELLELDVLQKRSGDASGALIRAARNKYPKYDFSIHHNGSSSSSDQSGVRLAMQLRDPSSSGPNIHVSFVGEGVSKAQEFIRTGRPQSWTYGEFVDLQADIPFFRAPIEGSVFAVSTSPDLKPRPVRVQFKNKQNALTFEYMQLSRLRAGTEEAQLQVSSENEAISFTITMPFRRKRSLDTTFNWEILGSTAAQSLRVIQTLDILTQDSVITITDLTGKTPNFDIAAKGVKKGLPIVDKFSRNLISLCAQIEQRFRVELFIKPDLSDTDRDNLQVLDCLLNGKDFPRQASGKFCLIKGKSEEIDGRIALGEDPELFVVSPVENYPGYFKLFDTAVKAPSWSVQIPCHLILSLPERESYACAAQGFKLEVSIQSAAPAKLIWDEPKAKSIK